MMEKLWTKVGGVLVGGFLLGSGLILAVQHVQAHTLTDPICRGLPTADDFFTSAATAVLLNGTATATAATPEKGTGESGEGNKNYYYAKITVPALTAGELVVTDTTGASEIYSSEGILCGRQEGNVSSLPSYASAHINADNAAAAAERDAEQANDADEAADDTETTDDEAALKRALRSAADDLGRAANALDAVAAALRRVGTTAADTAADAAEMAADTAETDERSADAAAADAAGTATESTLKSALSDAADDLATYTDDALDGGAAHALRDAAHALDPNMVFNINTLVSSGDEEYVVVMTVPEGGTPALSVTFRGVMSIGANDADGGSFTQNNQQHTHTLRATAPGLLAVRTTGNEVDTKGTLNDGTADIATDEPSGGNFEIVSPMDDDADYIVAVEGQTRGERGDYGLKLAFGVAEDLVSGGAAYGNDTEDSDTGALTRRDVELEPGRADYFFFTTAAADAGGNRFLTVETQKHADVTTETDTTGAFYGQAGQITTDTNSGTGNNFLLRAPVAAVKDYIIEVKGARSSTKGKYVLKTTSTAAPTQGSAPDGIMNGGGDLTANMNDVNPHSITVTKAGTLQVKTKGNIDTVGILYGPDGRQIATDDNSGAGMNFLITEYVEAGQYIVTVEGKSRSTGGNYDIVVNFVEGADIDVGTRPGTGTGTGTSDDRVAELEREVRELENDLNECRTPVVTDAEGRLENPSDGGFRSGIGVISGWVCAAEEVEVHILRRGVVRETFQVGYGTSRPDVPENSSCRNANAGFGMTYNFNHLPEGEHTIRAYADDELIGEEQTFTVVHLVEEFPDSNNFLELDDEVQDRGECIVDDFPVTGERTWLKWEQSVQNFVIEDQG